MVSVEERKMGLCERYSLSRSLISAEPAPIIAFTFSHPSVLSSQSILSELHSATRILIKAHPVLSAHFTDVRTCSPGLKQLEEITLEDVVVELEKSPNDPPEYKDKLDDILERMMAVDLQVESCVIPPWRIIWTRLTSMAEEEAVSKMEDAVTKLVVAFKGHHSLFDGLAAWNIARSFSQSFSVIQSLDQTPTSVVTTKTATCPSDEPCFPPCLDSLISTKPSFRKIGRVVFQELVKPFLLPPPKVLSWLGYVPVNPLPTWIGDQSTDQPCPHPRKKNHKTITVPPDNVQEIVQRSRHHGVTLTAFLYAALTEAIQSLNPEGRPLKIVLAVNLRPILPSASPNLGGGTYVAAMTYDDPSIGATSSFWDRAKAFKAWSNDRTILNDAISDWGLLSLISEPKEVPAVSATSPSTPPLTGMELFLKKEAEGQRKHSLEISNLGSVRLDLPSPSSTGSSVDIERYRWKPVRVVFTQAPLPGSSALVFSIVGCADLGGLEIALGWEEGVVGWESVRQLQTQFETIVKRELESEM